MDSRSAKEPFRKSKRTSVAPRGVPGGRLAYSWGPSAASGGCLLSFRRNSTMGWGLPSSKTWKSSALRSVTSCPCLSIATTKLAIVQNLEIFGFEIGNELPLFIHRHNVQAHHLRVVFAEIGWLIERRLNRRIYKACRREQHGCET